MIRKLDNTHLTVSTDAACHQAGRFETVAILGIEAVVAVVWLGDFKGAVERRGAGTGNNSDGLQLAYERASQARNHEGLCPLVLVFFVVGVLKAEDVARELDDRVLKAPSGSYERDPAFAGEPDRA